MTMELYDPLRRKYVRRTPEEEVRQMLIRYLRDAVGCPAALMASEYSFSFNSLQYRADIVVFDRSLTPLMMVECKAPSVNLGKEVTEQVVRYNKVLKVRYILISNGLKSVVLSLKGDVYEPLAGVPPYEDMVQNPAK